MYQSLHKQRGAAIIVALFVVSIVAISAILMLERFSRDLRSTELISTANTAELLATGSVAWAMEQLNDNWEKQKPRKIIDATPIVSKEDRFDQAIITSTIYAADANFNVNNLTNQEYEEDFLRLIRIVRPDISQEKAKAIASAVKSWIAGGNSNFEEFYSKQQPPYRESHRIMASISELRLVKGMTPELYVALIPYISALPKETTLNVNNADIPLLMTLSPTMTKASAETIVNSRKKEPFSDVASFMKLDVVKSNNINQDKIGILSHYFLVKTHVKVNEHETVLFTLIHREIKNAKPTETVLWQSKGLL